MNEWVYWAVTPPPPPAAAPVESPPSMDDDFPIVAESSPLPSYPSILHECQHLQRELELRQNCLPWLDFLAIVYWPSYPLWLWGKEGIMALLPSTTGREERTGHWAWSWVSEMSSNSWSGDSGNLGSVLKGTASQLIRICTSYSQ